MSEKNKKVFFIDDDSIFIFVSTKLIEEEDFCENLEVFEHGKNAIEALVDTSNSNQSLPEIIFLDLSMPVMSGWEFLDSFQAAPILNKESIKIIVMSSSINPSEIDMIKSYPIVHDYIVKPLTPADLNKIKNS
ncbi:response regulator [Cellulophaga sp. HaHaR_3_176]|uniref:response regulator n=1 Tax=Cellulophaga sp. HaHaR_3_176 TaxID=1942464 RepID=UPI001C1FB1E5|nr:response regulator [Cellulophaga sp. HaHaR_3_176]QWX83377.1 response regulator [Cellulophaga sp. HaHaR_3_176]